MIPRRSARLAEKAERKKAALANLEHVKQEKEALIAKRLKLSKPLERIPFSYETPMAVDNVPLPLRYSEHKQQGKDKELWTICFWLGCFFFILLIITFFKNI